MRKIFGKMGMLPKFLKKKEKEVFATPEDLNEVLKFMIVLICYLQRAANDKDTNIFVREFAQEKIAKLETDKLNTFLKMKSMAEKSVVKEDIRFGEQ